MRENTVIDHTHCPMFWLLVLILTLIVLAWRGVPLIHATGVLGILLLFYGWLGESAGRFVLLLLAYLAVFVPLNTAALRQEWISRALLEVFLQRLPPRRRSTPTVAAALLTGDWQAQLPPAAQRSAAPGIAGEALAAVLTQRLRTPLQPQTASAAQAAIASALYTAAAVDAVDVECLQASGQALAARLGSAMVWQFAVPIAAVTGSAPKALSAQPFSFDSPWLLDTVLQAHAPYAALLAAAHDDNPHSSLLAFDEALCQWLSHALTQAVRALVNGLTRGLLVPVVHGLAEPDLIALHRTARRSQTRLAVLVNALLLALAFGHGKRAARLAAALEAPLAAALKAQLQAQAVLQFQAQALAANLEQPLLSSAALKALAAAEQAQWQAVAAFARLPARWSLRFLLFPLGRTAALASDEQEAEGVRALIQHGEVRARLLAGEWPAELTGLARRCDALTRLEPALEQLARAQFEPPPATEAERLARALKMGFIPEPQHEVLVEALAFAQTLPNSKP